MDMCSMGSHDSIEHISIEDEYVLNGISRLLTAVMIVVSITVGLSFTLMSLDLSLL